MNFIVKTKTTVSIVSLLAGVAISQCQIPGYSCARTDTNITANPTGAQLVTWAGGDTGQGRVWYDTGFNSVHPPKYLRLTDRSTYTQCGGTARQGYVVQGGGDGNWLVFNRTDTMISIGDCFFAVDPVSLSMQFLMPQQSNMWGGTNGGQWSIVDPSVWYELTPSTLNKWTLLDNKNNACHVGSVGCTATLSQLRNYVNHCGTPNNNGNGVFSLYGIGAADDKFVSLSSTSVQDTPPAIVVYQKSTGVCYVYNTYFGSIRSYPQATTTFTGTLSCDGSRNLTATSGQFLDPSTPADPWTGLGITVTIPNGPNAGTYYWYLGASTTSSTAVAKTLTSSPVGVADASCPAGSGYTWSVQPGVLMGLPTTSDFFQVHNVQIDPSGTWAVASYSACRFSGCGQFYAWQIGGLTVKKLTNFSGGHWTLNANGIFNLDQYDSDATLSLSVLFRNWANFDQITLSGPFGGVGVQNAGSGLVHLPNFHNISTSIADGHPTNHDDPTGLLGYPVLDSVEGSEQCTGIGTCPINGPWSNEIVGYDQTNANVYRFGHTYNSRNENSSTSFAASISVGGAGQTGQLYAVTSDGMGKFDSLCTYAVPWTCASDVLIVQLGVSALNAPLLLRLSIN